MKNLKPVSKKVDAVRKLVASMRADAKKASKEIDAYEKKRAKLDLAYAKEMEPLRTEANAFRFGPIGKEETTKEREEREKKYTAIMKKIDALRNKQDAIPSFEDLTLGAENDDPGYPEDSLYAALATIEDACDAIEQRKGKKRHGHLAEIEKLVAEVAAKLG